MLNNLKELLNRDPFVPFRIVQTTGSSQLNYYYPKSDRWAVLRLHQVAAFEVMEQTAR